MAKEKANSKLIIWAVVALVIGIVLGLLLTTAVATGKAKSAISDNGRIPVEHSFQSNCNLEAQMYFYEGAPDKSYNLNCSQNLFSNTEEYTRSYGSLGIFRSGSNNQYFSESFDTILKESDGEYYGHSYNQFTIPFTDNAPGGYFWFSNEWSSNDDFTSNNGNFNEAQNPFIDVKSITTDCSDYYTLKIDTTGVDIRSIRYSLSAYNANGEHIGSSFWEEPNTSLSGNEITANLPHEITDILRNNQQVNLNFWVMTQTDNDMWTYAVNYIECAGVSRQLSRDESEKLFGDRQTQLDKIKSQLKDKGLIK